MFARLGTLTYSRRWNILLAALTFLCLGGVYGLGVFDSLKAGGFFDPGAESTRAAQALHRYLGQDEGSLVVLFTAADGLTVDSPRFRQAVETTLDRVKGQPGTGSISTYYSTGLRQLVSGDRHSTYAVVGLHGDDDAQVKTVARLRPLLRSGRLQVRLGGRPAVYEEMVRQVKIDLERAELLSFPFVGILLIWIFRSLIAASLPLVIGGMAILGSFTTLRLVAHFTDVSVFAINVISLLGFGLAIDYSLFVVSRFREELRAQGGDVPAALIITMKTAGHTVLFSGLTVVTCLSSVLAFSPMFLRSIGFGSAVAVFLAMLSALTVLPALLAVLGPRVNALPVFPRRAPRPGPEPGTGEGGGFWPRTSRMVMRHAGLVLLVVVPLLAGGLPALRINFSIFDARSLPAHNESRIVNDTLSQQFDRNVTQPISLVIHSGTDTLTPASLRALYTYVHEVAAVPGVRRIDSMVTLHPSLDQASYVRFYTDHRSSRDPAALRAVQLYTRGRYTVAWVTYVGDPYAPSSRALVRHIRALSVPNGLQVQVGGESAYLEDLLSSLWHDLPLALTVIVGAMFLLLFLMLGSLVIPLKAVILSILSLSFSFGALVWVFQDGHFAPWLGFTPVGAVDCTVPVLVFAGAFGLSMDYEVFLLSRIKEHFDRTGDMPTAVALGLERTGGIITSAALLLIVVIASFSTGQVLMIKELGIGLSLAVLVDATMVRVLLVPASMQILGTANWWAPRPLATLHRRLGLAGFQGEPATDTHLPEPRALAPRPVVQHGPSVSLDITQPLVSPDRGQIIRAGASPTPGPQPAVLVLGCSPSPPARAPLQPAYVCASGAADPGTTVVLTRRVVQEAPGWREEAAKTQTFCPHCGHEGRGRFCTKCGARIALDTPLPLENGKHP